MAEAFARLGGAALAACTLFEANVGPWWADCDFPTADGPAEGSVTLELGGRVLRGTIDPTGSGVFGERRRARVIAGAAGWQKNVPAKGYHNDVGVRARPVAEDAAREVGETLGTFAPALERVGADYARQAGPASRALEGVLGGVAWWVDDSGVTHAGPRPVATVTTPFDVISYNPGLRVVTLGVDDPGAVRVGSVLTGKPLDGPLTVREVEVVVTPERFRVVAWCGGSERAAGHLPAVLAAIHRRLGDGRVHGVYRYRVIRMAGTRVELQAVRKAAGLPDLIPVSQCPGVPGALARLTPGAQVLVQFLEGDPTMPVITGYGGPGEDGFAATELVLGGEEGAPVARQGDAVEVLLPPAVFSGTISGAPASGVLTFPLMKANGTITAGSGKVKAST